MTICLTDWKPGMRVRYVPQAEGDLDGMSEHYREIGGSILVLKMVRRVRKEIARLAANPHLAAPYELIPGARRLVVAGGVFLVFYGLTDCVEVLHIRRAEREPAITEDVATLC